MSIENTIEDDVEKQYEPLAKREPAALTALIGGPIAGICLGLAEKGVISPAEASTATAAVTGAVVAAVVAAQGFVIRRWVVPKWKHYRTGTRPNLGKGPVPMPAPEAQ